MYFVDFLLSFLLILDFEYGDDDILGRQSIQIYIKSVAW